MTLKRLVIATGVLAALTATATAKPVTLGTGTNLRQAPGTNSTVVTLMPKGETVEVGDCDAGWCKVTWNGQEGYAIARNLGAAPPPARRVARRYPNDGYVPVDPSTVYEDDGPVYYGPPPVYYGYYPRPYWYGGYGWRGGWHYHRRW